MNLKGNKTKKKNSTKIVDASVSYLETLLEKGVPAIDIVKELDQYLSNKQAAEFVEHYKKMYNITDAVVIESPGFTERFIEGQKELIDKYKENLKLLVEEKGINPADVVIAIDDYLNDYDRLRVVEEVKEKLNAKGDFRSLHTMARFVGGYPVVLNVLDEIDIPDLIKEQAVTAVLYDQENITDSKDSKVAKYTSDLKKLIEDGVVTSEDLIALVDEDFEEKVPLITKAITEKLEVPDSLDPTLTDYIKHQEIDPNVVVGVINETLPEEDKLILVDSILV